MTRDIGRIQERMAAPLYTCNPAYSIDGFLVEPGRALIKSSEPRWSAATAPARLSRKADPMAARRHRSGFVVRRPEQRAEGNVADAVAAEAAFGFVGNKTNTGPRQRLIYGFDKREMT
jgi:hypothetical protein